VPLLTEDEVAEIRRRLDGGVRGGPVLLKWIEQLLADRAQRIRMMRALVGLPSRSGQGAASAPPADGPSPDPRTPRAGRPPENNSGS
jgi:hypothetical protein